MRRYTVNEAAGELAHVLPGAWDQEIIRAILDKQLRGIWGGFPIEIEKPGAIVKAVICTLRADDLNKWLAGEYRFDEGEDRPTIFGPMSAFDCWIGLQCHLARKALFYHAELLAARAHNEIHREATMALHQIWTGAK